VVPARLRPLLAEACSWLLDCLNRLLDACEPFRATRRVALLVFAAFTILGVVLDLGILSGAATYEGPFRVDRSTGLCAVDVASNVPFWLGVRLVQSGSTTLEQNPQLTLDGHLVDLSQEPQAYFSRDPQIWLGLAPRELLFALPAGVPNDRSLKLSLS